MARLASHPIPETGEEIMQSYQIQGGADMQVKKVRFIISCLSLVASLAILAAPAFAQGVAFQSSSLPQQVRIEGLTETVGAVVLPVRK